jgi:hypothetical protein
MRVFEITTKETRQIIAAMNFSAALELFDRKYNLPGYGISISELPMTAELQRRVDDYIMFRQRGICGCGLDVDEPFFIEVD